LLADPEYARLDYQKIGGHRTMLGIPLLRDGFAIAVIDLLRNIVKPFTDRQIELVTTFADQALIAIENVRLFDEVQTRTEELSESLRQQTATAEVLQVISTSTGELEPVFRAMLENATRICGAHFGSLWRFEHGAVRLVSNFNHPPAFAEFLQQGPHRPSPHNPITRVIETSQALHIVDYCTDQAYLNHDPLAVAGVELGGIRTLLVVPMIKDDELLGAIGIFHQEVRPFTDKQIELVKSFASQAVIAIENARLLNELRQRTDDLTESLQQQTATSEVLQVISSSPEELAPVFNSILANARRICEAKFAHLLLYDGKVFRAAAMENAPAAFAEFWERGPHALHPQTGPRQAVATKQVVHIPDIQQTARYKSGDPQFAAMADLAGARSVLVVPMLKDDRVIGTLSTYREVSLPFSDKQIELVSNFAKQAVIAIENTRLLKELRESLQQQTATADVLKVISRSTFDLKTVLDALIESAVRLCDADMGAINRPQGNISQAVSFFGISSEMVTFMKDRPLAIDRGNAAGRVLVDGRIVHIPDVEADPEFTFLEGPRLAGIRTILGVPLLREGADRRDHSPAQKSPALHRQADRA
jgi:two-component system, NtrC family, sensor kinase